MLMSRLVCVQSKMEYSLFDESVVPMSNIVYEIIERIGNSIKKIRKNE